MTPRGILPYAAGLLLVLAGCGLMLLGLLYEFAVGPRHEPQAPWVILLGGLLVFTALHLLAAGLYRMLVHLYRAVSRTDLARDRPLRGRTVYLLGQLGCAMTVPTTVVFLLVPILSDRPDRLAHIIWGALPAGFCLMVTAMTFFAGLGIMVRDLFLRQRDIVEAREAERRRRLDTEPTEPQTEVLPVVRTADELREHIKEDR